MKSVENTRRELFEAWYQEKNQGRLSRGMDDFTGWERNIMYYAFKAAFDSVVIELPKGFTNTSPYQSYEGGWNDMLYEAKDAIKSTNLGIKVK